MKQQKEKDIQKAVMEYLEWKKIFHWRQKNTGFKMDDRWIPSGAKGLPDIFAVVKGQVFGLEIKSAIGKQSDAQKDWESNFVAAGGVYLLIRSLTELENYEIF